MRPQVLQGGLRLDIGELDRSPGASGLQFPADKTRGFVMEDGHLFACTAKWYTSSWPMLCAEGSAVANSLTDRGKEVLTTCMGDASPEVVMCLFVSLCRRARADIADARNRSSVYRALIKVFSVAQIPGGGLLRAAASIDEGRCPHSGRTEAPSESHAELHAIARCAVREAEERECEIRALESVVDELNRRLSALTHEAGPDGWTEVDVAGCPDSPSLEN